MHNWEFLKVLKQYFSRVILLFHFSRHISSQFISRKILTFIWVLYCGTYFLFCACDIFYVLGKPIVKRLFLKYLVEGPQWQSGNTLTSHL